VEKGAVFVADIEKTNAELQQTRQRLLQLEAALTSRQRASEGASIAGGWRPDNGATHDKAAAGADNIGLDAGVGPPGDLALREAISRLAADIVRLSGASGDGAALLPNLGKSKRRESRTPPSQRPETPKGVASAHVRQLQSTAPER
jgi:hypothetical protein